MILSGWRARVKTASNLEMRTDLTLREWEVPVGKRKDDRKQRFGSVNEVI